MGEHEQKVNHLQIPTMIKTDEVERFSLIDCEVDKKHTKNLKWVYMFGNI